MTEPRPVIAGLGVAHPPSLRQDDMWRDFFTEHYAGVQRGLAKRVFEHAGFEEVKTVLSSGNVVFTARPQPKPDSRAKLRWPWQRNSASRFLTIVRAVKALRQLIDADPYAAFALPPNAKRVVTFLRDRPKSTLAHSKSAEDFRATCRSAPIPACTTWRINSRESARDQTPTLIHRGIKRSSTSTRRCTTLCWTHK